MPLLTSRQFYDRIAGMYDQRYAYGPQRTVRQAAWLARLRAPGLLLDLGCGSGRMLDALGRAGFKPVGLDCSGGMLREARRHGDWPLLLADAGQKLPFFDACFGLVISLHASLIHLSGPGELERTVSEVHRVLKLGGIFVLEVPHPDTYANKGSGAWQEYQPGISCRPLPEGCQEMRLDRDGGASTVIRVLQQRDLQELLAGFERVEIQTGFHPAQRRRRQKEVLVAQAWR